MFGEAVGRVVALWRFDMAARVIRVATVGVGGARSVARRVVPAQTTWHRGVCAAAGSVAEPLHAAVQWSPSRQHLGVRWMSADSGDSVVTQPAQKRRRVSRSMRLRACCTRLTRWTVFACAAPHLVHQDGRIFIVSACQFTCQLSSRCDSLLTRTTFIRLVTENLQRGFGPRTRCFALATSRPLSNVLLTVRVLRLSNAMSNQRP